MVQLTGSGARRSSTSVKFGGHEKLIQEHVQAGHRAGNGITKHVVHVTVSYQQLSGKLVSIKRDTLSPSPLHPNAVPFSPAITAFLRSW